MSDFVAPRGQHQDGHVGIARVAPDGAAERDAVEPGQHQVEHDEVEAVAAGAAQRLVAVALRDDVQPLELEVQLDELADVLVVFHQQHTGAGLRSRRIHWLESV